MTQHPFETAMRNAGYEDSIVTSESDYGLSFYFWLDDLKVRVSDHNATNIVRMKNEKMFHLNNWEAAVEYMEKVVFPERFHIEYTGQVIHGIQIRKYTRK